MNDKLTIDQIELKVAGPKLAETGLLGWLTCRVNRALQLDGVALRRTATGRFTLSFPERTDSRGRRHPFVRPIDNDVREAIEEQVFAALGLVDRVDV